MTRLMASSNPQPTEMAEQLPRGERRRHAILSATRELLEEVSIEDLSVSLIAKRAGMTRSGFYFYFETKYEALATLMEQCRAELDELTEHFSARASHEAPAEFVRRIITGTAAVFERNHSIIAASHASRNTDETVRVVMDDLTDSVIAQVQRQIADEATAGTAHPIAGDTPALARILSATTQLVLVGDSAFVEKSDGIRRALPILEALWLHAIWRRGDASGQWSTARIDRESIGVERHSLTQRGRVDTELFG